MAGSKLRSENMLSLLFYHLCYFLSSLEKFQIMNTGIEIILNNICYYLEPVFQCCHSYSFTFSFAFYFILFGYTFCIWAILISAQGLLLVLD